MRMTGLMDTWISGQWVLPLIEGGKGISVSSGESAGAFAAAGGVGTFSGVCEKIMDRIGPWAIFRGKNRQERAIELVENHIENGIKQAKIAHDVANGQGRIHMNVLWEIAYAEKILEGILEKTKGLIHGITCGAGMPYRLAEIAHRFSVHYYPIVSSARAFSILWKRSYHQLSTWLGGVVYEDPWVAGGHNGISNKEDPKVPEDPFPRVREIRAFMNSVGLEKTPVIMAGGVWKLKEWESWFNNPQIGPIAFQLGTRPLLTQESPISDSWKKRLLTLKPGDVSLNQFSPTGFFSSAVRNAFLRELEERSERQVSFASHMDETHSDSFSLGRRTVYLQSSDRDRIKGWQDAGFVQPMVTPNQTLIFVTPERAQSIRQDQIDCKGCLSHCRFSNFSTNEAGTTGHSPDPRSFCIHKSLSEIIYDGTEESIEQNLMFAGQSVYRFGEDPWYASGFIPTVKQLVDRLMSGE